MEHKLEWQNEDEGILSFFENGEAVLSVEIFLASEEEAELRIQDVVFLEKTIKDDKIRQEVACKMTKYVVECFRLLWEMGYEETVLVEPKETNIAEILDSTKVVQVAYKEYMMKHRIETQKSTGCGLSFLHLTKTEDGYDCENAEKTFFCRLLNYTVKNLGERSFYLYEVEVKEEERNQGIATACLKALFGQLSKDGPVDIWLQVGSYNEPAVHLYQKLGFEISEEICYYAMEE